MKKLERSTSDSMVCGVCSGIARFFGVDPTLVRVIWVLASIILGAGLGGIAIYIILAVIMPKKADSDDPIDGEYREK